MRSVRICVSGERLHTDSTPEKTDLEKIARLLNVAYLPPPDASGIPGLRRFLPGCRSMRNTQNTRYSQTLIKAGGALPRIDKLDVSFGDERE
uniref:Uncharacterized protein n=1 Tax=Candidatus Kentrum sp. LPFa TaxID=2126335 RepID=A0A450W8N0_9GAMM|nr:MAG: hypothetical protein BECKLPF1236A_GA0070988_1008714 [Candidatus Kentron sp. LPFa]VFK29448.1 MAG: hypothetical protein BECKLPF1236C_GA0070990_1008714 [Candidatus Kentron sp. LPFa]